ncbi:MAG: ester cyclase [Chloroflexi bacterium]|nr:ester cyclase [Chloroflexota bacterium]
MNVRRLSAIPSVLLAIFLIVSGVSAQSNEPACDGDYLESVRELGLTYIAALNAHDLTSWYNVLADDYTAYYAEEGYQPLDKDAALASDQALLTAFPNIDTEIHVSSVSSDCRLVTFRWTSSGTFVGNGNAVSVLGMTMVEVADGQILNEWVTYDVGDLMTQMGLMGTAEETTDAISQEAAQQFADRFDAIFDGPSLDVTDEIFADDFVAHLPLAPELDREGWKAYVASFYAAFSDLTQEVNEVIVAGNQVVLRVTYTGTHDGTLFGIPATGNAIVMNGVGIFTFNEDGLAVENWANLDVVGVLAQIGVFPPV